jgi:hypothetical protein
MPDSDSARPGRRWTQGERLVALTGVLLAADLVLLPWHHYRLDTAALEQFGVHLPGFSRKVNGLHSPQAFFGIAALVLSVGMVLQVLAAKLTTAMPRLEQLHLVAGPTVLGLLAAKLLADHDFMGAGAWLGIVLAAGLAYGGFTLSQETTAGSGNPVARPQ